jgi:hypothetical protein
MFCSGFAEQQPADLPLPADWAWAGSSTCSR